MAIIQNTNTSTSPRRYMVETVRGLEQAVQNINRILAIGTEMTDAQIAASFDIVLADVPAFKTLFINAATRLNHADINNLINRIIP